MIIVQPKWLTQPRSRQASAGPSDMSTPKTTGSGCMDCSSRVSELQDQVEALSRELAESKERQHGMGKEIDALKELFEGMRSAVFTAPSAGPVKLIVSSPQGTSGDIPASHTPPVAPLPASLPAPVLGDIPAATAEPFSRPISPLQEPPQLQHMDIEVSTKVAAPAKVEAPAEFEAPAEHEVPAVLEAPVQIEAPAEIEAPVEIEGSVDIAAPGQMQVDSEHLIYTFIFFILMDCVVAGMVAPMTRHVPTSPWERPLCHRLSSVPRKSTAWPQHWDLQVSLLLSPLSRIDRFSLGPNEEGSKRGRDGSRRGRDF